jgi:hypothetical protein
VPPAEEDEAGVADLAGALLGARLGAHQVELGREEVFPRLRVAQKAAAAEEEL